ncbi:hypothetical protein [Gemmiger sp. An120]|uniref:YobI family P-loop NTPase n=1 Tax=Gemmiger sp. An120 TaxID=1965549 RepID=UPI00117BB61E|nr:hypothetical protein [Gemmiger sp. An120]
MSPIISIDRICGAVSKVASALQHKCPFVPKGDAQKGEDYTEYRALLPIDNIENGDEYIAALRWAFENKKIRNIALTGPYGSGKSSIIETFLTEDEEAVKKKGRLKRLLAQNKVIRKSALKISMATFEKGNPTQDGKNELISVNEDEVEKGILKQLFYKVEPGKIPQSRYRKLHKIRRLTVFRNIAIGLILISLLVAIFGASIFEKYIRAITDFLPARFSAPVFTVMMMALLLIVLSGVGSYLYITVISRFKVKEVKLPTDTTVQSDNETPDSVFNKNLDEIMYFFESTGYRTVFFEDLDRLTDPKIFVHLRELNNLLNNDDAIRKRPIVFVYAVRDDIFSREDRTKFFDFIIPVIPVINSTNSGEILLQMLQKAAENDHKHEVSEGFVLDVAPYISDMRVLRNIYNEFVVYKKTLRTAQGLSLSDEQMLAMMVFKNLYPNDFADIQDEKGIIKTAFLDKQVFLAKKQQELQKRIDTYTDTITGAQQDAMKTIRELKYAMVGTFMEGFHEFEGFSADFSYHPSIAAEVVMHDDFDMTELLKKGCKHICVYVYNRGSQCYKIDTTSLNSYIERWKRIKEVSEKGLQNLQEELQELRDEQHSLSGMTFVQMLKRFPVKDVLSDEVRSNKLLVFLLRRGYIDEKYANYINYFKGTSITKDDMNFILSVKNQTPLAFDYSLTKTPMVVERLQPYEFEQKAICNFALMEELLAKSPSDKLTAFLAQLSDESENSWNFIDEFIDKTKRLDRFIGLLADKWPGMWAFISANETLTYERQLQYLRTLLNVSDAMAIKAQNQDGCMACYFEQHEDILQQLASCNTANVIATINDLEVRFEALQIAGVPNEVLDCVFDGCHYVLSDTMIHTVVSYKDTDMLERLAEQPYTTIVDLGYEPLIQYVYENFASYVRDVVLAHATLSDRVEDIVDMLVRLKDQQDLQLKLVRKENFHLDSIEACAGEQVRAESEKWKPVWNALLEKNAVGINWENVISYWEVYKLGEELKRYISLHADELSKADPEVVPDDFIQEFILADVEPTIQERLLPVLRMKNFTLAISSIDDPTLRIMIDCQYFAFTDKAYSEVASKSPDLGLSFILHNQDAYMEQCEKIPMTTNLLEDLLLSSLRQEYKSELFSVYAEKHMTTKIALQMKRLCMPVTQDIFDAAWDCVDEGEREQLLLENCLVLDAVDLEQKFREMGGNYTTLADRTRRHEAELSATPQHALLAEHLRTIGYITNWEEKEEKSFEPVREKEMTPKLLKLRIRPIKLRD